MNKLKKIPNFKSEAEERQFWQSHDSTQYVDYSTARRASFPNLKLSSRPITVRLPETLIERLKIRAHKMDIPYQVFIKKLLFEGLSK
ncbi:MAG TPA: BrnA antitoxin family protein [Candidatus Saccharimonadales bacterium]|nr:BrnA antitoxin family protein [Candidatus Saccharimonadales bacterium]